MYYLLIIYRGILWDDLI